MTNDVILEFDVSLSRIALSLFRELEKRDKDKRATDLIIGKSLSRSQFENLASDVTKSVRDLPFITQKGGSKLIGLT